jgi:hypothetical protein
MEVLNKVVRCANLGSSAQQDPVQIIYALLVNIVKILLPVLQLVPVKAAMFVAKEKW